MNDMLGVCIMMRAGFDARGTNYGDHDMPVKQLRIERSADYSDMVASLAAEWAHPVAAHTEPVVVEQRDRAGKLSHVYVIWSLWNDVERTQRSEIIMDAAERCFSEDEVLNITIAMGLTAKEAAAMGIVY
jgi:hypothetical protein